MQPRVIAILVAHSGVENLERTVAALTAQTRVPDALIGVDASGAEGAQALLSSAGAIQVLVAKDAATFGAALSRAMHSLPAAESESEWLWLLGDDNAPAPDALERLLGAVEIAPSVAVAGPKLMRRDDPAKISEFGHTLSQFGASVILVRDELDQAQHDTREDVLGVSAAGMLVRRTLWTKLAGFDPGLPDIDASLDFCIRARLAGQRVIVVPQARVSSSGGPELFGRTSSSSRRTFRHARVAQLHRRLVYSPRWALALHWLSLLPLAIVRSVVDLIGKRPGAMGGEISAALAAAFSSGILPARRNLRRHRVLGWNAIASLRVPASEVRERRLQEREARLIDSDAPFSRAFSRTESRAGFVAHGGLWTVLLVGVVGLLVLSPLFGAAALSGGGLRPLDESVAALWSNIGLGWRGIGTGTFGAADPFAVVIALLGSLTWWSPDSSVVLVYVVAMPLAALGAWFAARRFVRNQWTPMLAAILWAFAPPLLGSLAAGHLGAIVAHLVLPWLVIAAVDAARSWAAGAAAALLFAVVAAGAPSIVPALVVLFVVLLIARPTKIHRILAIPLPALVLFAPLIIQQVSRGNALGLLADPGVPVAHTSPTGWQLALGDSVGALHGWPDVLSGLALPASGDSGIEAAVLVSALLAPLGLLALLSLFLPGAMRAVPALAMALLGYLTAVTASTVTVGAVGSEPVSVLAAPGLSLLWLGIGGAAILALDALGRARGPVSVAAALTSVVLVIPVLGAFVVGSSLVHPSNGRILPALVTVQASTSPSVGTLVITSQQDAGIAVRLERGGGATLDDQSTLVSTQPTLSDEDRRLAVLAGNLSTRSGFDYAEELSALGISFIVVPDSTVDDETYEQTVQALDGNEVISPVGTTANGLLWRFDGESGSPVPHVSPLQENLAMWYLVVLGIVFGITALLAIPVGVRPHKPRPSAPAEEPAGSFIEDDHA